MALPSPAVNWLLKRCHMWPLKALRRFYTFSFWVGENHHQRWNGVITLGMWVSGRQPGHMILPKRDHLAKKCNFLQPAVKQSGEKWELQLPSVHTCRNIMAGQRCWTLQNHSVAAGPEQKTQPQHLSAYSSTLTYLSNTNQTLFSLFSSKYIIWWWIYIQYELTFK